MDGFERPPRSHTVADIMRAEDQREGSQAQDRAGGDRIFTRLGDAERIRLVSDLIDSWRSGERLNRSMVGAIFRQAWDSEPYMDGVREGSYLTAVAARARGGADWSMGELVGIWGMDMMTPDEACLLEVLTFPITVYRGGTGKPADVARGVSWTLDARVASFYAEAWPRRWGNNAPPVVLSLQVERTDVAALFDGRSESEIVVTNASARFSEMKHLKP